MLDGGMVAKKLGSNTNQAGGPKLLLEPRKQAVERGIEHSKRK